MVYGGGIKPLKAWQGNVKITSSNVAIGKETPILNTNFEGPGIYTAQFSVIPLSPAVQTIRCVAVLNWVLEGNQVQRVFDIGNGISISGAGSGIILGVQDQTATLPTVTGTNGAQYQIAVTLVKGTRAQFQIPLIQPGGIVTAPSGLLIIGPVTIPAGLSVNWPVPQNAGVIGVKVSARNGTTATTRPIFVVASQFNVVGGTVYYQWLPDADPSFIPLVPGCNNVNVANNAIADSVNVSLDWAIDG
jgi:hypothetical protein